MMGFAVGGDVGLTPRAGDDLMGLGVDVESVSSLVAAVVDVRYQRAVVPGYTDARQRSVVSG